MSWIASAGHRPRPKFYWLGAVHDVLVNVVVAPVALSVASGVIVVDGNHGGANRPAQNRRSNQTFLVDVLIF